MKAFILILGDRFCWLNITIHELIKEIEGRIKMEKLTEVEVQQALEKLSTWE
ncbi:hypothetical protein [Aquibacillus albus]|uniref:Uncharacterized protein n=1 Tax=Aquibacillus albus TaxID=1168171 RepID=A0ABS2N3E8_9BACI|nr:hypothetical protein [Aquibacillus albus]MBM7572588.1 hypothetical protein [Aquibacillus albus]